MVCSENKVVGRLDVDLSNLKHEIHNIVIEGMIRLSSTHDVEDMMISYVRC